MFVSAVVCENWNKLMLHAKLIRFAFNQMIQICPAQYVKYHNSVFESGNVVDRT